MDYKKELIQIAFEIGAIDLNFETPFTLVSGYKSPIYIDNRLFIYNPQHRRLVANAFTELIDKKNLDLDIIAGVATSGIPFAVEVANLLDKPFVYVRKEKKSYGAGKQIEGIKSKKEIEKKQVLLIEDLITRGTNSIPAISAIREAKGICNYVLCIFDYETEQSAENYKNIECNKISLLTFQDLLKFIKSENFLSLEQMNSLEQWYKSPFTWQDNI